MSIGNRKVKYNKNLRKRICITFVGVVEHVDPKIKKNEEYLHVYQLALREVGE
jgi:hypothetical protein